jgi:hypothetical protein
MKSWLSILILLLSVSFWNCESHHEIDFIVLDKSTKLPLENVYVNVGAGLDTNYNQSGFDGYTDSNGRFNGTFMTGMSYEIRIIIEKKDYQSQILYNENPDTIYLLPNK